MKNSKRRLLSSLALVLILILSTTVLSGCYVVKSGKMSQIEGTYQLTHYSGDGDRLVEKGITMYMVIRADGTGWYAYKDSDKAPHISELRCRFTQDEEESGKYSYVEIDFEGKGGYEKFAINSQLFKSTNLNSQKPVWKGNLFEGTAAIDYYINVDFTRVDKATDRSVIDEHFASAAVIPYGAHKYNGTYSFNTLAGGIYPDVVGYVPPSPFVYLCVDIDIYSGKGVAYYMLKSDEIEHEVAFDLNTSGATADAFTIKLGEKEVSFVTGDYSGYCMHIPYRDMEYIELSLIGDMSHEDIVVHCQTVYSSYLANKPITE